MSIDGPPSTPEHAITLRDLRSLTYLTASDIARCANLFGEDHMYTKEAIRLHAILSALAAEDEHRAGRAAVAECLRGSAARSVR